MTFEDAVAAITDHFTMVEIDKDQAVSRHIDVCSGGIIAKPDDPVPALFISREMAIDAWCETMLEALDEIDGLESFSFADGPHCDTHVMTNQTIRQQQRVVENRFSVTARIGLFTTTTG